MVPETAKTCNEAALADTEVIEAKEARTEGKDTSEHRMTAILRSTSKVIKAKLVWLAPTSPKSLVIEDQIASISSRSLGIPSHSS